VNRKICFQVRILALVFATAGPLIWSSPAYSETADMARRGGNAEQKPLDLKLDASSFYKEPSKEPSWMHDENYQSSEKQLSNQCREMKKQINALKGKPQRKFVVQQRYESECLR